MQEAGSGTEEKLSMMAHLIGEVGILARSQVLRKSPDFVEGLSLQKEICTRQRMHLGVLR